MFFGMIVFEMIERVMAHCVFRKSVRDKMLKC
jgi:hypothetical protein